MTWQTDEWREPDERPHLGIELSIAESVALWDFFQRDDCPTYWTDPVIASIANKAKSFHKYGPWDDSDAAPLPTTETEG